MHRREEHRCKEWKRSEVAGHHRGLVSGQGGELTCALVSRGQGSVLVSVRGRASHHHRVLCSGTRSDVGP